MTSFIVLFTCLLFILFGKASRQSGIESAPPAILTIISTTATVTPTKWWVKTTATTSPATLGISVLTNPTGISAHECSSSFSSLLQPGKYAYISLIPPLPNRLRAGAGKAYTYFGQIQPGAGVKIIGGPLCADGFSWWLVESVEGGLRGWTVAGSDSEQWVLPCPNPIVACRRTAVISQATLTTVPSSTQNNNEDTCNSDKFSIGMLTQVEQGNLLVIRSEPYIGSVLGHAGPTSAVTIVGGPACAGDAVWWKVNVATPSLTGWAAEANLRACLKEDGCT